MKILPDILEAIERQRPGPGVCSLVPLRRRPEADGVPHPGQARSQGLLGPLGGRQLPAGEKVASTVSEEGLLSEIRRVRRQSYAIDNQEDEGDGRCVAAAVEGPNGRMVAAPSITGAVHRMDRPQALTFLGELRAACTAISETLTQL